MADMDKLADDERRLVARLLAGAPKLADTVAMAMRLHQVLRRESDEPLQDMLTAAADTLLAGFAANLGRDQEAVQATLTCPGPQAPSRAR